MIKIATLIATCCLLACVGQKPALAQSGAEHGKARTWFVGIDDLNVAGKVAAHDYADLFKPNTQWPRGFRNIDVFQMRPPWVLRADNQEVFNAWRFLGEHHIKIAVTMSSVITQGCGEGIEGFDSIKFEVYPRSIKQLNLPIDYMVVDEPSTWGHEYSWPKSCQYSIADTARRVAISIRQVQKYYPDIKIVLIEALQALKNGAPELLEFLQAFRKELRAYPEAVRFDMQWNKPWQRDTPGMV